MNNPPANISEHTQAQGLRVHHLANLGGLIALAGLDREPPDFLLGALLSVAEECGGLDARQRERIAARGRQKLNQRATSKRAWKSWQRARDAHALSLSSEQIRRLIVALGGSETREPDRLVRNLMALLGEEGDVAAVAGQG